MLVKDIRPGLPNSIVFGLPDLTNVNGTLFFVANDGSGNGHVFNLGHGITPDIDPEHQMTRPSLARRVVLRGIRSQRPVYVTPYALGGLGQSAELSSDGSRYRTRDEVPRELGVDLKYHVTPNLTLDLSANTDFAQVEADNQVVNLTRFDLFFPEKRQFFQDRAGTFRFPTGTFSAAELFHSRRIGVRDGAAVPILAGARLVGRVGEWDVGALTMQTEGGDGFPSENFGVLRARRRVLNPVSRPSMLWKRSPTPTEALNQRCCTSTSILCRVLYIIE